ncbi:MAG: hypothetical protein WCI72_03615 [archaeon]
MANTKRVLIESPFKGKDWSETRRNILYARLCVRDSILRGEAPFASHLFYTQTGILDDKIEEERMRGINAGLTWGEDAQLSAFYQDFGFSRGMEYGLKHAQEVGRPIEKRSLGSSEEVYFLLEEMAKKEPFIPTGILF